MKERLFAILLALIIVGVPTCIGLRIAEQQVDARLATEQAAIEEAQRLAAEWQADLGLRSSDKAQRLASELMQLAERAKADRLAAIYAAGIPMYVDLEYWRGQCKDVVGYIYNPGTAISYPIVRGADNDYYLYRDLYGNHDINGSIMLDYHNPTDFSDGNNLLYGHNMNAGNMFASLCGYKQQSYFDAHPTMYLYTFGQTYRIDLFAGFPCPHDGEIFYTGLSQEQVVRFKNQSTFVSPVEPSNSRVLTLVTCSYEHENWRYVVLGNMVPIG